MCRNEWDTWYMCTKTIKTCKTLQIHLRQLFYYHVLCYSSIFIYYHNAHINSDINCHLNGYAYVSHDVKNTTTFYFWQQCLLILIVFCFCNIIFVWNVCVLKLYSAYSPNVSRNSVIFMVFIVFLTSCETYAYPFKWQLMSLFMCALW